MHPRGCRDVRGWRGEPCSGGSGLPEVRAATKRTRRDSNPQPSVPKIAVWAITRYTRRRILARICRISAIPVTRAIAQNRPE